MDDGKTMVSGLSSMVCFVGVVTTEGRVEGLRGRTRRLSLARRGGRRRGERSRSIEGLFEALLHEAFNA